MDTTPRFRFGPFELDSGTFKLLRDGEALSIEPKGIDLLRLLLERAPRVVEKPEIFSIVWKDVAVTDNALTRLVTQIRKALEDDPKTPRYIETIATRGYRFVADVHRLNGQEFRAEAVTAAAETLRTTAPKRSRSVLLTYGAIGALVVLSTAALVGSRLARKSPRTETWLTEAGIPDVVKLAALKPEQITAGRNYDGFVAFAPDGKTVTFSSDRSGALEVYVQSAAPGSTATALTSSGRHAVQPVWSPDGQFIAYHEIDGKGIWVVPSRGGVARKVSEFGASPSWSPDGRRIAFQSLPVTSLEGFGVPGALSTIWIVDAVESADPVQLTRPGEPAGPHLSPHWLHDSNHLLFAAISSEANGGGTSLWNIDVRTRERQRVLADKRLTPDYVVAPNGRAVYFVANSEDTIWWLPLGPEGTWQADPQPTGIAVSASQIAHLTISADGRHLGWTGLESSVQLWATRQDSAGSEDNAYPLTQGLGVRYGLPLPTRDGRIAFMGTRAGSNINLFLLTPPSPMRQITADAVNHRGSRWLPGERELAYVTDFPDGPGFAAIDPESGRTRRLFQLTDVPHPEGPSQASTASPTTNIAINPDFTALAIAIVTEGRPNVWLAGMRDQRPDGTMTQLTRERDGGSYPVWSADGRWLAYQCNEGSDTNVCVTRSDGGGRIQLTHEPGQSWVGGWKSDNDSVLFAAERDGVWNIQSVTRTTGRIQELTHFTDPPGHVRYPRWDPAHRQVVFERAQTTGRIWTVELPD